MKYLIAVVAATVVAMGVLAAPVPVVDSVQDAEAAGGIMQAAKRFSRQECRKTRCLRYGWGPCYGHVCKVQNWERNGDVCRTKVRVTLRHTWQVSPWRGGC